MFLMTFFVESTNYNIKAQVFLDGDFCSARLTVGHLPPLS